MEKKKNNPKLEDFTEKVNTINDIKIIHKRYSLL